MSLTATAMCLRILLPHRELLACETVTRIDVETVAGSWSLLPNRLDCVAALVPGVLLYVVDGEERAVAVDEGVLTKAAQDVTVAVREAVAGASLGHLRRAVEEEFRARAAREAEVNAALARLEAGFVRRFAEFGRG